MHADAAARLQQAAASWSLDPADATGVIDAACRALVAGLDTPSLRMLAAVSVRETRGSGSQIAEVLRAALEELDLAYPAPGGPLGRELVVRAMATRLLHGDLAPRALAAWAHRTFGHDLPLAEPLAVLDDVYDTLDYSEMSVEDVDAEVRAAAAAIVGPQPGSISKSSLGPS